MSPEYRLPQCRWLCINGYTYSHSPIYGISFQNPRREIFCAAVHGPQKHRKPFNWNTDTQVESQPVLIAQDDDDEDSPLPQVTSCHDLLMSRARIESIVKVHGCYLRKRVIGMLLENSSGVKSVLGQWYVEGTYSRARYEKLFDSRDHNGRIAGYVRFIMGRDVLRRESLCKMIDVQVFLESPPEVSNEYRVHNGQVRVIISPLLLFEAAGRTFYSCSKHKKLL